MKKFFMVTLFAVLSCVTLQNTANAEVHGCVPANCDTSRGNDTIGVYNMIVGGGGGAHCYVCEKNYCENGDIVYYKKQDKFVQCIQSERGTHDDHWINYTPRLCDDNANADIKNYNGVEKKYRINGNPVESYGTDGFDRQVVTSGQEVCYYYDCKDGTEPDHENKKCVDIQKRKAEQEAQKRQKQEEERKKREQQNQIRSKKDKCENSGGSWSNGKCVCNKEHMMESNGVCICDSHEYEIQGGYCVMIDSVQQQKACLAASGTTWNPTLKKCECNNASMYYWNKTQCVESEDFVRCKSISGATWNNGCVCVKSGYILNDAETACIEDPNIVAKREIIAAGRVLDGIAAGFDVSVWKNAQGEFNTARLASDSIAGVVLGTVGGVVTSSVMKKHQVEDGFEDLKCTIGGQPVAGWGDEFNVGVQ